MKDSDTKIYNPIDLHSITKEDLLNKRISELELTLAGSEQELYIQKLYQELSAKGLTLRPLFYLSDEWGCIDGFPVISIPFYLLHPRLKKLENEMMLEVEGEDEQSFLKLLRHETGHAINYAYKLYTKKKWRKLFGTFSTDYNTSYRPRPYSKRYVRHLDDWYAQCHPDEDFAETFAVWLTPDSNWKQKYQGWPAEKKLYYVDTLMKDIAGQKPLISSGPLERPVSRISMTLNKFYLKKRGETAHEYPQFYDDDLREIFIPFQKQKGSQKASIFLKKHRVELLNVISYWTAENKFTINRIIKNLINRCAELNLGVDINFPESVIMHISTYLTTLIMNYYYTGNIAGD